MRPESDTDRAVRVRGESNVSMSLITEPYLDQKARWPGRAATSSPSSTPIRSSSTRRTGRRSAISPPATATSAATSAEPDELDQAELPLDDVPLRLGHQGRARRSCLAVRLRRLAFDQILRPGSVVLRRRVYGSEEAGKTPSPGPTCGCNGTPTTDLRRPAERRAIQLGLRGDVLARDARRVAARRRGYLRVRRRAAGACDRPVRALITPREDVYPVDDRGGRSRLGIALAENT